jgi:predicted metal-dependent enzyme (double-stranded beta helix superfamily)
MKVLENRTGWINNPVINSQINQSKVYNVNKEAWLQTPFRIPYTTKNVSSDVSIREGSLKSINHQKYHPFFMQKSYNDMILGLIPNFEKLYDSYLEIETEAGKLLPAINFLPALRNFSLKKREIASLLKNPEPKHILAQNEAVKIILIRWEPGQQSDIHGHAIGGGLIKVLYGEIEELRYTADRKQHLLSKSTYLFDHISYIDDVMGLHSVKNNHDSPSLTLHIYTPGNYKVKKYGKDK